MSPMIASHRRHHRDHRDPMGLLFLAGVLLAIGVLLILFANGVGAM